MPVMLQGTDSELLDVDFVVAADGSGDFLTVQEAIDATQGDGIIAIKPGEYREQVDLADPPTD